MLLLDQRGTGRSTPVCYQTLTGFSTPIKQAEYLKNFRADSIVRDAELIRHELIGEKKRWSVLGQSYGGFCVTHYLSAAPKGLSEAIITGGLPPLNRSPDDVYRATYKRVVERNRLYYKRYPEDIEHVQNIVEYLTSHDVILPGGGRLTPRRFQQLGFVLGMSNGLEQIHYLIEGAFTQGTSAREATIELLFSTPI